jgi:hypothetical protein
MTVQRLLGAAWTAVHGPSDPARLLRWLLEQGMQGLVPGPAPRALAWRAIADAAEGLPIAFPAVRAGSILRDNSAVAGLASGREADQLTARAAVADAVGVARILGARLVILDPGLVPLMGEVGAEDLGDPGIRWTNDRAQAMLARRKAGLFAALDRTCRALFDLCKHHPDIRFCLTPGRSIRTVAGIDGLEAIVEDLGSARVGYWHDCAVTARREQVLGEAQGLWLDKFSNLCEGCTLGDSGDDGMYLPPGAGGVDYPLLAAYLRRPHGTLATCLELDPGVDRTELPGVRAYLERFGL